MYFSQANLQPWIPPLWLAEALDDNSDGSTVEEANTFAGIQCAAQQGVDGILSLQYKTPILNPEQIPFLVYVSSLEAARICYARRGYQLEGFPHAAAWKAAWAQLASIGKGELQLDPGAGTNEEIAKPRGSIVIGGSGTYSRSHSLTA